MLENPTVQEWLDRLQGRPRPVGGIRPGRPIVGQAAESLGGIIRPQTGDFGFRAPQLNVPRFRPEPSAPSPGRSFPGAQNVPGPAGSVGARDLGGGAIAAGLGKLGAGAEQAMADFKAKQDQQKQIAAMGNIPPLPPLRPLTPIPPDRPEGIGTPVPTPPARPIFSQPGVGPSGGTGSYAPLGGSPQATLDAAREAIAAIESRGSGDYSAIGPTTNSGDRAYGRYQVMGANVPSWTKAATGTSMTPQQFLADKAAQDAVFNDRFGGYLANGSLQDAASQWFTGKPVAQAGNVRDVTGTSAPQYLRNFNREFAAAGGQPGASQVASSAPPSPPSRPSDNSAVSTGQSIVPGQSDPHQPGFDPSSVKFLNTPLGDNAASVPIPPPPGQQGMNAPSQQDMLAAALAQGQGQVPPPVDPGLLAMMLGGGGDSGGGFFGGGGDFGGFFG